MKSVYKRENLIITEFDVEDVIVTSGEDPIVPIEKEIDNSHLSYGILSYDTAPGPWF